MYFKPALAWKCTIKRPWAQGSVGERDTLGTQQHAPLLQIDVPASKDTYTNEIFVDTNSVEGPIRKYHLNGVAHVGSGFNRQNFTALAVVRELWEGMCMPSSALNSLTLLDASDSPALRSSYTIGILAQSSIALSALAAAQIHAIRNQVPVPRVEVLLKHAVIECKSERLYRLNGKPAPSPWGLVGGLHETLDGSVRIHDSFPNHAEGALELLGLPKDASRQQVSQETAKWASIDLESVGIFENRLAIYSLRSYQQWDLLPRSKVISNLPILLKKLANGYSGLPAHIPEGSDKCLRGLRVIEMSRVIAAPLAGKTLAAHGADVLWVTSPSLPALPTMDRDFELVKSADVFIQGLRPGSLASRGLSAEEIIKTNPGIIIANMSAFGPTGPWSNRRGFDSLVQTCNGMNVSEAAHFGAGEAARPLPCQILDHAGGYLLATGIIASLYRQSGEGVAWQVDISFASILKYLRSLGQYPGSSGFRCNDYECAEDVKEYLEAYESGFGLLEAMRHSAAIEGCSVGWEIMPKRLGSDGPKWLR
ncbi:coA-transferase family III domain-containing protein [Trichoderma breve]|uniref:CoA-transferase family III domain-containing protein n=1 Tax=Trichoderma breve TaxID=2034170 RepID=A0A9W9BDR9_9HYPO|nr:coA-transferase family III domain-containing protein [Trichoderma breve]KAJ4861295.1 coA-transferase family III domain-containing protein [Trichoderma breve]